MTTRRRIGTAVASLYDVMLPVLVPDGYERGELRLKLTTAIIGRDGGETINTADLGPLNGIAGSALLAARTLLRDIDSGKALDRAAMERHGFTDDDIAAYRALLNERFERLRYLAGAWIALDTIDNDRLEDR